jgi:hypothetical protein
MKKYEFSSSLSGVTETIEADWFEYRDGALMFFRDVPNPEDLEEKIALYLIGPGSFVREIKEPKDA